MSAHLLRADQASPAAGQVLMVLVPMGDLSGRGVREVMSRCHTLADHPEACAKVILAAPYGDHRKHPFVESVTAIDWPAPVRAWLTDRDAPFLIFATAALRDLDPGGEGWLIVDPLAFGGIGKGIPSGFDAMRRIIARSPDAAAILTSLRQHHWRLPRTIIDPEGEMQPTGGRRRRGRPSLLDGLRQDQAVFATLFSDLPGHPGDAERKGVLISRVSGWLRAKGQPRSERNIREALRRGGMLTR